MEKETKEAMIVIGVMILIVLIVLKILYILFTSVSNVIDKEKIASEKRNKCIYVNNSSISEYTLKCIGELKVEENAYIANTCFKQAKELYGCN